MSKTKNSSRYLRLNAKKVAIIDAEDYDLVGKYKWSWYTDGFNDYVTRAVGRKGAHKLHRIIMNAKPGQVVDHINGNGLDNRKSNLRICSHQENAHNQGPRKGTSKFKGVSWNTQKQKWIAQIQLNFKKIYLGQFNTEKDAARAFNVASKRYHGEFGYVNKL